MKKLILIAAVITSLPAHAESNWSIIGGAGRGTFAWCGGDGCWHQSPLPYQDDRRTTAYLLGARYTFTRNFAMDGMYHSFTPVRVSGNYVDDKDYDPQTRTVRPNAPVWALSGRASMITRTDGISISAVPMAHFGNTSVFSRVGVFMYRQSTDFTYPPLTTSSLREAGRRYTPMYGIGIGQTFNRITIATEVLAYKSPVKWEESPVGGGGGAPNSRFGLVQYMLTFAYQL